MTADAKRLLKFLYGTTGPKKCDYTLDMFEEGKMKECPFCGHNSAPEVVDESELQDDYPVGVAWCVVCNVHKGGCGGSSGRGKSPEEAVQRWERRKESV